MYCKENGIKIKVLPENEEHTAMGLIADTFRKRRDTVMGDGIFRICGRGAHGTEAVTGGLDYAIANGGKAVMFGVDIYKLTAMHYVEGITPKEINAVFEPGAEVRKIHPHDERFIETGHPPVKAWYTIQKIAYERGLIQDGKIGSCTVMVFNVYDVISIYEAELKRDPFGLWGIKR